MSWSRPTWTIKLTHEPTGISVQTDSSCFKQMRQAHNALLIRLKSKIYACMDYKPETATKFSYRIDEGYMVDDLETVRREVNDTST